MDLSLDPCHAETHYNIGILYERRGRLETALAQYRLAWRNQSDHTPYLLALVETLVALDQNSQALDLITQYLEQDEQAEPDASLYVAAGNILLSLQRPPEAVNMFRQAAYIASDNPSVTESLAYALLEADRPKEAVKLLEQLRQKAQEESKPFPWSNSLALGDAYMKIGKYYQAQRCYEIVREHDTSNPAVWNRLGQAALARSEWDRARAWADKALALQPNHPEALMILAYLAYHQENYTSAEELLRKIVAVDAENGLAWSLLGQTYQALGRNDQALACYVRALKIDPHDQLARTLMVALDEIQVSQQKHHDKL